MLLIEVYNWKIYIIQREMKLPKPSQEEWWSWLEASLAPKPSIYVKTWLETHYQAKKDDLWVK